MSLTRRVLVADDQRPTQQGLHALLDLLPGVEWVGEASNGREAVLMALEKRADVVLMDVRMPVWMGWRPRGASRAGGQRSRSSC